MVRSDGVYCFAIESPLAGGVDYASREMATPPRLLFVIAP
jgi:hypothetical protein